jgi:hypothetical protein
MKRLTISEATLRRLVREELATAPVPSQPAGNSLGKLLDDVSAQFTVKMKQQYPGADDVIAKEANDLKTQLVAQIKASAARVKMQAGKPS